MPVDDRCDRAGVIAVRDSRRSGLQVLLRESSVAAASAAAARLSFPVGRGDLGDHAGATLRRCRGLVAPDARRLLGSRSSPACARGCWVTAARVLFAATGLLFAVQGEDRAPAPRRAPPRERHLWSATGADFADYLIRERLHCDLGRLCFFTEWAGPGADDVTRFFLVRVPGGRRSAGSVWRAPDRALLLWRGGGADLDFAAFACLRILTDFSTCDALLSEYRPHEPAFGPLDPWSGPMPGASSRPRQREPATGPLL